MINAEDAVTQIRSVTDEEIDHFFEHGWVTLRGLFTPELAGELLSIAQSWMGDDGDASVLRDGKDIDSSWFKDYHDPSRENEIFRAVATAPQMGQNSARLLGRDAAMLFLTDLLAVKLPSASGRGEATDYHQDYNLLPFDVTSTNLWVALDEVTPAQGSLQFYSGSQRLGKLGRPCDYAAKWPRVKEHTTLSEPAHLMPGDATIHGSLTIHGSGGNNGDRPRWAYILSYLPADARFTNLPYRHTEGLGFKPFQTIEHAKFPRVYDPATSTVTV